MECTNCGATIENNSTFCSYCGSAVTKKDVSPAVSHESIPATQVAEPAPETVSQNWSSLPLYYQEAFLEIERNGGKFMAKWNWAAFLFGCIWYFVRGMWAKGLILLLIALGTSGTAIIFLWIYSGIAGTYDYYLLKAKGKQLW